MPGTSCSTPVAMMGALEGRLHDRQHQSALHARASWNNQLKDSGAEAIVIPEKLRPPRCSRVVSKTKVKHVVVAPPWAI